MELKLLRTSSGSESTLGQLYIDRTPECFTLEDQFQKQKVKGETRIPAGRYKIEFREVVSPMTERYRAKYPWFTYHLHLTGVKGFQFVYLHAGNTDDHTDGCLLVGDSLVNNQVKVGDKVDGFLGNSGQAFKRVYIKIFTALKKGEEVHIDVETYKP